LIQFNGKLSSWWTSIAIGVLTLVFIGVQSLLASWNARQNALRKSISQAKRIAASQAAAARSRRILYVGGSALVVVVVAALFVIQSQAANLSGAVVVAPTLPPACTLKALRQDEATALMKSGAVIAYERNGGNNCVDELYGIFPDGRITANNGSTKLDKTIKPDDVNALLGRIDGWGWFTDNMYSTKHTPCAACYTYYISVLYKNQTKTIYAVDGGTDAPANYWQITADLTGIIPQFPND